MLAFATVVTALAAVAQGAQLNLYHRIYHPSAAAAPFSKRATIQIAENSTVSFQLSIQFAQDLFSFAEALHTVKDKSLLLYQVALEPGAETPQSQWHISSVKACHLPKATAESLQLHVINPQSPTPYALNYFISPIPHDGACPKSRSKSFDSFANVNSTVVIKASRLPPLPQLTTPPPISAQGEPIVPVPEKSFVQKYWMYMVGILLAISKAQSLSICKKANPV
ncbi:hypothetical protein H0H81_006786 [Sphagnurus paluster]|uniref:ER membrane protein complex subunit 10 n=1 Tax=Sphagnurus paluster TaxID=117069 RepID=A0A9P7KGW6_9AGAR|nr:hypothetical protein H0H81_006786 [Sphagnurus paluster]